MSVVPAPFLGTVLGRGRLPVWIALGGTELRRLVRHPVFLVGSVLAAAASFFDPANGPRDAYYVVTAGTVFFLGPCAFFAANLLATRDRRHGLDDWLRSLPARRRDRTAAALLACAGPMAAVGVLTAALVAAYLAADAFVRLPAVLELVTAPLAVLGGALLGVMVARWAPLPGAAALVMAGLVAVHLRVAESLPLLGAHVEFARWGATAGEWAGLIDGSRLWHALYLAGLCAMAALGALLVDARRRGAVVLLGVVVTAGTALAGWAQLP